MKNSPRVQRAEEYIAACRAEKSGERILEETVRDAFLDGWAARGKADREIIDDMKAHYPMRVFPPHSESLDSKAAGFARHVCEVIDKDVEALDE